MSDTYKVNEVEGNRLGGRVEDGPEFEGNNPQEAKAAAEDSLDGFAAAVLGADADEQNVIEIENERTGEVTRFD